MSQTNLLDSQNSDLKQDQASAKSDKRKINMEPSWLKILQPEFDKDYMHNLRSFLAEDSKQFTIYPDFSDTFNAFWKTPFEQVKVVILGQDPYHGPKQAHGLCFSVQKGVALPPSLRNIFKELKLSMGLEIPKHGCLESWAEQGVFLLNTSLSVRAGQPQSHAGKGWEEFTDKVIQELNDKREGLVFLLWGAPAKRKASMIDRTKHKVLEAVHPSPLSAHRGFFGSNHFNLTNEHLKSTGQEAIDWSLPE